MADPNSRPKLTTVLLVAAIGIMIVQNFFLVRKSSDQQDTIESLKKTINVLTQVQIGDTIDSLNVITMDSTLTRFALKGSQTKTLLLVFTTDCNACEENMPQWNALVRDIPKGSIRIVGLTADSLV